MNPPRKGTSASADLDALRALSAILVAVGHVRLMLVHNTNELPPLSVWAKSFYLLTSFGPNSVMLFFVLSGFFIGSSVINDIKGRRWSWVKYAISRITRIHTVLVPALAVGMVTDIAGSYVFRTSIVYSTPYYGVMLPERVLANISPSIALGNVFCLQEIFVPTLGSNHALWSLTNEFWYYLLFPLAAVAFSCLFFRNSGQSRHLLRATPSVVLFSLIVFVLTPPIRSLFAVWLMGAALGLLPRTRLKTFVYSVVSGLGLIGWLAAESAKVVSSHHYVTGTLASIFIYALACSPERSISNLYERIASRMSGFSYTLYLTHVPFVVFAAAIIVGRGPKLSPNIAGVGATIALTAASCVYAHLNWMAFESRTQQLKKWLERIFLAKPRDHSHEAA